MTTHGGLSMRRRALLVGALALAFSGCAGSGNRPKGGASVVDSGRGIAVAEDQEGRLLSDILQLTFDGRRSGEGYFSRDGSLLVFQSERERRNPFFAIYLLTLGTGETRRVSPGFGKATCGWIHPRGTRVLFASTHLDPAARAKQREEISRRAAGSTARYAWDYDEHFDIFEADLTGQHVKNLTHAVGYDAEGSWSPDGTLIVFSSNRGAYRGTLSARERDLLGNDASYFLDVYRMNADGTDVRRLTDAEGADGGPFFSPDGKRIVWRRFSADGRTAEIFTMNVDGTDQRQITRLGAMSGAPYYHPSGDYVIFSANVGGLGNFELYLVDTEGRSEPARVTSSEAFDGLPVFSPDGTRLTWTSTRNPKKKAQIFSADWNDQEARRLLQLASRDDARPAAAPSVPLAASTYVHTESAITARDLRGRVAYLASEMMDGRLTGSDGERRATEYVASMLGSYGLEPAGDGGTFFQAFDFTAGVSLGSENRLAIHGIDTGAGDPAVDREWRPLAFSKTGSFDPAEVVCAGYGIVAPANGVHQGYDSYAGLDVTGKWALSFRYLPEKAAPDLRQHLSQFASLRHKAMVARDRGARGLIITSGPNSNVKDELVRLSFDASLGGTSLAAISVSDRVAELLLAPAGKSVQQVQDALDGGAAVSGFTIPGVMLAADIDVQQAKKTARNVLARLPGDDEDRGAVVVGAHVDHLGEGFATATLARREEEGMIHPGADDNASGVAALLEIAESLAAERARGAPAMRRSLLFAAWSGEELGLLGSSHFTKTLAGGDDTATLSPTVAAYLNMDMIGRLARKFVLLGVGSSSIWPAEIERANTGLRLPIVEQNSSYLPTDATPFYVKGVPILSAFTGAHADYHTPRDTAGKIDYAGTERITRLMARIATSLASAESAPDYLVMEKPDSSMGRANMRAYLGTIPDYSATDVVGVKLSGVAKGGPADRASVQAGDVVVELAGKRIENIYDYTFALEMVKIGVPVGMTVQRGTERVTVSVTPASRD